MVFCTDVKSAIQTVIQTVVKNDADAQTVDALGVAAEEPLNLNGLYVCTIFTNGLYNGLYV